MGAMRSAGAAFLAAVCCADVAWAGDLIFADGFDAAGTIVFSKDYSAAAVPAAGFSFSDFAVDTQNVPPWFTATHLPAGWPGGAAAYRVNFPRINNLANDFPFGWEHETFGVWTFGDVMHVRWRLRFTTDTNWIAQAQSGTGIASTWRNKIVTLYGYSGSSRIILQTFSNADAVLNAGAPARLGFTLQKDGGADIAIEQGRPPGDPVNYEAPPWHPGQILDLQIRVRFSSSAGVADGGYAYWINNNDPANPTAAIDGIVVNANGGASPQMNYAHGGYNNNGTHAAGVIAYDETGFEVGTAFHPAWHR